MQVDEDKNRELAAAFLEGQQPKAPTAFAYSAAKAIDRAQDGSTRDAVALLLLASAMLRTAAPTATEGARLVPGWMADYLAAALEKAALSGDATTALHLARSKGRSAYTNEERDSWIAFVADTLKRSGRRDHLVGTADLLAAIDFPLPRKGGGWTVETVQKAIEAHSRRIK